MVQTLVGHVVRWDAQARDDRGITFMEGFARMKWQMTLGLGLGRGDPCVRAGLYLVDDSR